MSFRRYFTRRRMILLRALLWLAILLGLAIWFDSAVRPPIRAMSQYQAKVYATRAINTAVEQVLSAEPERYDALVSLSHDGAGAVTAVQTDMSSINLLKAAVTAEVTRQLALLEEQVIRIPIGTLTGGSIFSGRGPRIVFRLLPAGYAHSSISHAFDACGINQSRHQLLLQVDVNIIAIIPGYSVSTAVSTQFCIAETVIVGIVPDAFTQILREDEELEGDIIDYGAERDNVV